MRRGTDLARICSFQYEATVLPDNTVRLAGMVIDIPPGPRKRSYAGARIALHQFRDGSWRVYFGAEVIATHTATTNKQLRTLKQRRRRPPSGAWNANARVHQRSRGPHSELWPSAPHIG